MASVGKRSLWGVAAALSLGSCASPPPSPATAASAARPKLAVVIVVDGLPQRQVVDYRDQLGPDGLRRFLDQGAWFSDAHYGHSFTVTGAGHATLLTGAYPHRSGIIGNDWRRHDTGEREYCAGDEAHQYIGHPTKKLDGTSPRNLKVESLGDVLKAADARSKVIAVSGKDRGAILPAGHTGTAYMYQASTGRFASTTYYMKSHPAWVEAFNGANPADRYFHAEWKPLLEEAAYARSLPDHQKWYRPGGGLPKKIGGDLEKPGAAFYAQLIATPFSDRLTLDFARAAIAGEQLGADDAPDILSISLSAHDYVNHAYGAESRISHDHVLQLDRALAAFLRDLDAAVGRDHYVAVLTADHGFMPAPEHSQSLGRNAGRQSGSQTLARINKALAAKHGEGTWVRYFSARAAVLDRKLAAERRVDPDALAEDVRALLVAEPGILAAYTRAELGARSRPGQPHFDQVVRSWHPELSGDVEFVLRPYWMMTSGGSVTTHGSPHPYDTHVPMHFHGPAWVKAGERRERVEVADLAPTLAAILGVRAPAAAEGRALALR